MKNLKQQLDELRGKFLERIEKREFEIVKVEPTFYDGYLGTIVISIDNVNFNLSVAETYVAQHSVEINLGWQMSPKSLSALKDVIGKYRRAILEEQKKKIEAEINGLSN